MLRSFGARCVTLRSPIRMSPPLTVSSPAIIRSSVDLPHPDGPSNTTNAPSSMVRSMPCTTSTDPYALRTRSKMTEATG